MAIPTIPNYQNQIASHPLVKTGGSASLNINNPENILVSIVTVVYNAEKQIEETFNSVFNQSYPFIEYIVIDGCSTDNTLSIIQKYGHKITYWLSQPDEGIYDAMNKGIALAKGEIVALLNAGDTYYPDTISKVVEAHISHPGAILTGACKVFLETKDYWIIEVDNYHKIPSKMIPHASVFVPRKIYQACGLFDLSFKIAADYDFICRCFKQQIPFYSLQSVLSVAAKRGKSGNYYLTESEFLKVRLRHHLLNPIQALFSSFYSFLRITIHLLLSEIGLWSWFEAYKKYAVKQQ